MKKEMLINVLQPEECRIAIVEDGLLEELYVERTSLENYTGNIYKGRIVNIEPAIQAAFVDFSVGRNGFLHVSDVEPQYYRRLLGEETELGGRDRGRDPRRTERGERATTRRESNPRAADDDPANATTTRRRRLHPARTARRPATEAKIDRPAAAKIDRPAAPRSAAAWKKPAASGTTKFPRRLPRHHELAAVADAARPKIDPVIATAAETARAADFRWRGGERPDRKAPSAGMTTGPTVPKAAARDRTRSFGEGLADEWGKPITPRARENPSQLPRPSMTTIPLASWTSSRRAPSPSASPNAPCLLPTATEAPIDPIESELPPSRTQRDATVKPSDHVQASDAA